MVHVTQNSQVTRHTIIFDHYETFIVADLHHAGHVVGLGHAVSLFEDSDCTIADGICLAPHGDYDYFVDRDVSPGEDCAGVEEDPMTVPSVSLCACRTSSGRKRRPHPHDRSQSLGTGVSVRDLRHRQSRHAACAW